MLKFTTDTLEVSPPRGRAKTPAVAANRGPWQWLPRGLSFRASLTISIAMLVILTGVTLTVFSFRSSRANTAVLADALFREVTAHAVTQARDHVLRVVPVAKSLVALGDRGLTLNDPDRLGVQLTALLRANAGVTWVSYSDESGRFTGAYVTPAGRMLVNQSWIVHGKTAMVEYDVTDGGAWKWARADNDSGYDPRKRSFYETARQAGKLVWLPPYIFYEQGVPGITCANPLYDQAGKLLGVLTFDFDLNALSALAADLSISANSKVILLTPDGVLLAHPKRRMDIQQGKRAEGKLPTVKDAGDPEVEAFFAKIRPQDAAAGRDQFRLFDFDLKDAAYFGGAHSFQIDDGPVWIVGAIAPQSDFLGGIYRHNVTSLLISVGALFIAVLIAGILAKRVSGPIVKLASTMHHIGTGNFSVQPDLGGSSEFQRLSEALNQMITDLREGIRLKHSLNVAQEVQQKLLPMAPPTILGLDIAGHTAYCDETGGDYLDYLILEHPEEGGALIAVGDVVGHGVAAALLMATARGILRSRARASGDLGEIVTHLNDLLVADMRDGRFITLCLMVVDPKAGVVRWARAGHDPAIMYDPTRDEFGELCGNGGPPLGIEADLEFEECETSGLGNGHVIALGTDGIWETTNDAGEFFGKDRLRSAIRSAAAGTASDIAAAIQHALADFRGPTRQRDDITFAIIKVLAIPA